jgi:cardiolipin synthase
MLTSLALAAKSGVDVRIITPHIPDKKIVHLTTRSYYAQLIGAGVRIYEYKPGFIHSKEFISDDITAVAGTANLDFRSLYLHFECGVRMYNIPAIAAMKEDFINTLQSCIEITSDFYTNKNIFICILQDIMRLCAPLM